MGVDRVERDGAFLVQHLDLREDGLVATKHLEGDLDTDRPTNVDDARWHAVMGQRANGQDPGGVVARGGVLLPHALRSRAVRLMEIAGDDISRRPIGDHSAAVDLECPVAELGHRREHVGDVDDRPAGASEFLHAPETSPLEFCVADREHLVDDQDVRLEVRGNGNASRTYIPLE